VSRRHLPSCPYACPKDHRDLREKMEDRAKDKSTSPAEKQMAVNWLASHPNGKARTPRVVPPTPPLGREEILRQKDDIDTVADAFGVSRDDLQRAYAARRARYQDGRRTDLAREEFLRRKRGHNFCYSPLAGFDGRCMYSDPECPKKPVRAEATVNQSDGDMRERYKKPRWEMFDKDGNKVGEGDEFEFDFDHNIKAKPLDETFDGTKPRYRNGKKVDGAAFDEFDQNGQATTWEAFRKATEEADAAARKLNETIEAAAKKFSERVKVTVDGHEVEAREFLQRVAVGGDLHEVPFMVEREGDYLRYTRLD